IFDLSSGAKVKELRDEKVTENVRCIKYMPDGKNMMVAYADGYARLWNIESSTVTKKFKIKSDQGQLAISPDSKLMVSAGEHDRFLKLWDIESGEELKKFEC